MKIQNPTSVPLTSQLNVSAAKGSYLTAIYRLVGRAMAETNLTAGKDRLSLKGLEGDYERTNLKTGRCTWINGLVNGTAGFLTFPVYLGTTYYLGAKMGELAAGQISLIVQIPSSLVQAELQMTSSSAQMILSKHSQQSSKNESKGSFLQHLLNLNGEAASSLKNR